MSQIHGDEDLIPALQSTPIGDNKSAPAMPKIHSQLVAVLLLAGPCLLLSGCGGGLAKQASGSGGGTAGGGDGTPQNTPCNVISLGPGAALNGFRPFPADSPWNQDVSAAAVDSNSSSIIGFIGPGIGLHPDFGSGLYQGASIGIPYVVVSRSQANVGIDFTAYGDESDPGPMPVPANAPVEGAPNPGDRHVLVVDNNNCFLYELYNSSVNGDGTWNADSAAVWDLQNGEQRPWGWTSADAAGLPIFPGLVRYDEVAAGQIQHALRFTVQNSRPAMVPPASHFAGNSSNAFAPPMGMKLRLKAGYDIRSFSATNQVILAAMKKYGLIVADNGSSMYISGAPDPRWDNDDLHNLSQVQASAFEVVQMNPIYTAANQPQGSAPSIASFTAGSTTVSAGSAVTLNWQATDASYFVISPQVGALRGTTTTVAPTQTTTYTLYAANQFGRSSAAVTITVP
jgi:hypothetical protein